MRYLFYPKSKLMSTYLFSTAVRRRTYQELSEKVIFDEENTAGDLRSPSHSSKSPCSNVKYSVDESCKYKIYLIISGVPGDENDKQSMTR